MYCPCGGVWEHCCDNEFNYPHDRDAIIHSVDHRAELQQWSREVARRGSKVTLPMHRKIEAPHSCIWQAIHDAATMAGDSSIASASAELGSGTNFKFPPTYGTVLEMVQSWEGCNELRFRPYTHRPVASGGTRIPTGMLLAHQGSHCIGFYVDDDSIMLMDEQLCVRHVRRDTNAVRKLLEDPIFGESILFAVVRKPREAPLSFSDILDADEFHHRLKLFAGSWWGDRSWDRTQHRTYTHRVLCTRFRYVVCCFFHPRVRTQELVLNFTG